MTKYVKKIIFFILTFTFGVSVAYGQWQMQLPVQHRSQQEDWSCGPNTIAMWAGYVGRRSIDVNYIADNYTGGRGSSTIIPEFMEAMYRMTPYGYVFSEWAYTNKYAAIKGVMYNLARYNEPVAFAGNNGLHYYLIVGGGANRNPYTNYGTQSSIQYLYVYDSRENSPIYDVWWRPNFYPILRRGRQYTPDQVMNNWQKIGASGDQKWRSIERAPYAAWGSRGATYYNRTVFFSY